MAGDFERVLLEFIMAQGGRRRFTQDTPILPDVWLAYAKGSDEKQDLILTPWADDRPKDFHGYFDNNGLRAAFPKLKESRLAANGSDLVATMDFETMVGVVLPLTDWWEKMFGKGADTADKVELSRSALTRDFKEGRGWRAASVSSLMLIGVIGILVPSVRDKFGGDLRHFKKDARKRKESEDVQIKALMKEYLTLTQRVGTSEGLHPRELYSQSDDIAGVARRLLESASESRKVVQSQRSGKIWGVSLNRKTTLSLVNSRRTVKADAAERVFDHDASVVTWAVVDSGIDATHPAFLDQTKRDKIVGAGEGHLTEIPPGYSRVTRTYDFVRLRDIMAGDPLRPYEVARLERNSGSDEDVEDILDDLKQMVLLKRQVDWSVLEPIIKVPHSKWVGGEENFDDWEEYRGYRGALDEHGTHVAGILGGDWRHEDFNKLENTDLPEEGDLKGVCPNINLIDVRVFNQHGEGDEFSVMAALQFLAYLNRNRDVPVVNGVNLSLSLKHRVSNFGCGQTPICLECNRLVGAGIVVVAAAGNNGYQSFSTDRGMVDGYLPVSITDPGNADKVITVGATHRERPHSYGVSYFSSRGPTGDGRLKPDLIAPGERILSLVPEGDVKTLDGTSQAAPHVSGAAAVLMARHNELRGSPERIKEILCSTATDLGRERHFQGAGLLDILRALEAV